MVSTIITRFVFKFFIGSSNTEHYLPLLTGLLREFKRELIEEINNLSLLANFPFDS